MDGEILNRRPLADYCCAYNLEKKPCRRRFDCEKYAEWFRLVEAGYFREDRSKLFRPGAPFKLNSKKEMECTYFLTKRVNTEPYV